MTHPTYSDGRPVSATHSGINYVGLAGFLAAMTYIFFARIDEGTSIVIMMAGIALPIIALEYLVFGNRMAQRAAPAQLHFPRIIIKLTGLAATLAVIAAAYMIFPVYSDRFLDGFLQVFALLWLPFALVAPLYIAYVDSRMSEPEDGLFYAGLFATGQWQGIAWPAFGQYCLGWLVKGFFLPMMLSFFLGNLRWFFDIWVEGEIYAFFQTLSNEDFFKLYKVSFQFLYTIDVAWACAGYFLTLKLLDSHIRSTEPTGWGWLVCLVCYPPFWPVISSQYLSYNDGMNWHDWFVNFQTLKIFWAMAIFFLIVVYVSATIQFGIRFSNLTHRGILTNGPYRWMKHPAYVSKNLSWWLISMPFLSVLGPTPIGIANAGQYSLLLLGVNAIYFFRAKTEERHLMRDPVYQQYSAWMKENSLYAKIKSRLLPRPAASDMPTPLENRSGD